MKSFFTKYAAHCLTGLRIVCGAALLFCPPLSLPFYCLYGTAGFSDMIDGTVARKTGSVSAFGSVFDTTADFVFFAACLIRLVPVMEIPGWIAAWTAVIALIKTVNAVSGIVMRKKLVVLHTEMNKAAGVLLFALPPTLPFIDLRISGAVVCAVATFAAVQEGHFIRTGREE